MNEFKNENKVVQANELVTQTNWKLNETSLKIFKILVSCLDTNDKDNNGEVKISKHELYKFFNYEKNSNYAYLRQQMQKLQKQIITMIQDNGDILDIVLIPNITWKASEDVVCCEFNKKLLPYLINLKNNFIMYDVAMLKSFNSKYTIILYEYIKAITKGRSNEIELELNELRKTTNTESKFKNFSDFRRYVLDVAISEINKYSDLTISYEPISNGRKTTKIKFKVTQELKKESVKPAKHKGRYIEQIPNYSECKNNIEISEELMNKYFPK